MHYSRSVSAFIHFVAVFLVAISGEFVHAQTAGTAPIVVRDDRGITHSFAVSPQRIVSLLPSLAESVCALGHCGKLVGVDRYTLWPASLKPVPKMGGGLDPDIEQIVAAKPDVVLMAESARAHARLTALGLRVLTLEPKTHADVQRSLALLDKLLNGPQSAQAAKLWQGIEARMVFARAQIAPAHLGRRVYFEVGSGPWAAGPASFIGETLSRLGAVNIIAASMGVFPQISPEFVVRANPQLIFINEKFAAELPKRPGWVAIAALKENRVCALSADDVDLISRPGPRLGEAAERMLACLARP